MTVQDIILGEISKQNSRELARIAMENPDILGELWQYANSDDEPLNWRSAWIIKGIWEENPELVSPYIGQMIEALPHIRKDGVRREFLRIILEYPLPDDEEKLGILLKNCFAWLAEPGVPIAIKVHSMTILFEISKIIPEIKQELITTIEVAMQEGSAGIVSRGSKTIRALHKNLNN